MRLLPRATDLLVGLVVTLFLTGGHALAAPPGQLTSVLTADEKGKPFCEVKIVDETGKGHKLHIDVQTNQVVKAK